MNTDQMLALKRLQAIDWAATGKGEYDGATHELFFSYMAVAADICRRHGLEGALCCKLSGLFDFVPRLVGNDLSLPQEVEAWCTEYLFEPYRWRSRWYVVPAARGFILWEGLTPEWRERIAGKEAERNPYELLFAFFERGGALSCEHNMFDRLYPLPPDEEVTSRSL